MNGDTLYDDCILINSFDMMKSDYTDSVLLKPIENGWHFADDIFSWKKCEFYKTFA